MGKVVEKIENNERVEKLSGEQVDDLFTKLLMGKDYTEEIKTSRGSFTVKFPKTQDHIKIGKIAAFRRNYQPVEGFDMGTESLNIMSSTLDVIVVEGPEWYENAKKLNANFSFMEVPSREFLAELYGKARSFREEIELRIDPRKESDNRSVSTAKSDDDPMDGGAFGNISNE